MDDIRNGNCPLCNHHEILEGQPAEFSTDLNVELPMAFAYRLRPLGLILGEKRLAEQPFGKLQYYMCRSCGFTQWFVDAPGEVPVGEEFRTRLIQGTPRGGSYR